MSCMGLETRVKETFNLWREDFKSFAQRRWKGVEFQDPVELFLENKDHGLEHSSTVFEKTIEIAARVEFADKPVDIFAIAAIAFFHDFARFFIPKARLFMPPEAKKGQAEIESEVQKLHPVLGADLFCWICKRRRWQIPKKTIVKIRAGIRWHDFLQKRFSKNGRLPWPITKHLEVAIFRLADKIALSPGEETRRYFETGQRRKTPFFLSEISLEERMADDFENRCPKDQLGFLLVGLLGMGPEDFGLECLQEIYRDWERGKDDSILLIFEKAKKEGLDPKAVMGIIDGYLRRVRKASLLGLWPSLLGRLLL